MLQQLATLLENGRCPQAMVLDGGTLEERLSLATEVAAALVGTSELKRHKVLIHAHPDVIYVRPEDKKKTLSVDVIRNMRSDAFILPNEGDRKVYIIEQAELMQEYGQNALLKILEEPPQFTTFILCCESKSVLLGTVLSRVAVFSLEQNLTGGVDETIRADVQETAEKLVHALVKKQELELLGVTATLDKKYEDLPLLLDQLELLFRDALVRLSGNDTILSGQPNSVAALAQTFSSQQLFALLQVVLDLADSLPYHANKNLTLSRLSSNLFSTAWSH